MPKEAIHFKISSMISNLYKFKQNEAHEFTWASILPDMFFYVPSRKFLSLGNELHKLEAKNLEIIEVCKKAPIRMQKILLGIAIHLATDDIWHRQIDSASEKLASAEGKPFSTTYYHRLIESLMQRHLLDTSEELSFTKFLSTAPNLSFIGKYRQAIHIIFEHFGIHMNLPDSLTIKGGTHLHCHIVMTLQKIKMPHLAHHRHLPAHTLPVISLFLPEKEETGKFLSLHDNIPEIKNIFSRKVFNTYLMKLTTHFHELLI